MKTTFDTGILTLKNNQWGVQFYCPIITLERGLIRLSFPMVLVISKNTWQFDWSAGFQILGFGFGVCAYKKEESK